MSVSGIPDANKPENTSDAGAAAAARAKQAQDAEQVKFTGVQAVLEMMYAWAEQLEQQVSEAKGAAPSPAGKAAPFAAANAPVQTSALSEAELYAQAKSDPKVAAACLMESIVNLGKELEMMGISTKGLTAINFNQDPQKFMDQVLDKLKALSASLHELKSKQEAFAKFAKIFPELTEENERVAQALEGIFAKTGSLSQVLMLKDQLERLSKEKNLSLAASADLAKLLKGLKESAGSLNSSIMAATGPFKNAQGALGAMANKLVGKHSPEAAGKKAPQDSQSHESLAGLAEELLLGILLPECDQSIWAFSQILSLENALELNAGPLAGHLAFTYKINPSGNAKTELAKLLYELKNLTAAEKELKSMEAKMKAKEQQFISKYGSDLSKWPPFLNTFKNEISAISKQLGSIGKQMSYLNGMIPELSYIYHHLEIRKTPGGKNNQMTPGGHGYEWQVPSGKDQSFINKWGSKFGKLDNDVNGLGAFLQNQSNETTAYLHLVQTRAQTAFQMCSNVEKTLNDIQKAIAQNLKGG